MRNGNGLNTVKTQMPPILDGSQRIPQFDSLRFIGAIAVMLFHYAQNAPGLAARFPGILSYPFLFGAQFVYMFFIMSGFLMQRKYKDSVGDLFHFLWKRLRTLLVPVFLSKIMDIVLSAVMANVFSAEMLDKYLATKSTPSVNLSNIVIDSSIIGISWSEGVRFNGVTWFISSLFLCYFLFWLVETAAAKYREWIWIMLTVIGYNIWVYGTFQNHIWVGSGLTFFSLGCVLSGVDKILSQYKCYDKLVNALLWGGVTLLMVLTLAFRRSLGEALGQEAVLMGYYVFPALLLVAIGHNPLSKILSNKILSGLGCFSMGIYLLHMIMMKLLIVYNILTGERIGFASFRVLLIYVLAVVGVSIPWHVFIEKKLSSKVLGILEARV